MLTEQWQLGLVVVAFAANLLFAATLYAYRRRREGVGSGAESEFVDPEAGVVTCTHCAAENEDGYRFCRACVNELPTGMSFESDSDTPLGRLT